MSERLEHPGTDEEARAHIERLGARAERLHTEAPGGGMVWHAWGEGPPLVLLHGGSGSWTHWIRNIPHFMGHRRVLAADLPGLGDSPEPKGRSSAESLAGIVSQGIESLLGDDPSIDLVGFSFGGIIAGNVAALNRFALRSLTIVGSPIHGLGPTGPANEIEPVDPALGFEEAEPAHRRNLERLMLAEPTRVDALALRLHYENLRRARLRSRKIARTQPLAPVLERSHCRRHGIWGARDVTIHPDLASIREAFGRPGDTFDVLEGTGHWAAYEAPEAFNRLLDRRLSDGGERCEGGEDG